jgi:hypothetical protein
VTLLGAVLKKVPPFLNKIAIIESMIKKSTLISKKDIIPLWSNLPFFIPAAIACYKGLWFYGAIIAAAALVSLYYHHTDEVGLKRTDKVLAYSVIFSNLYILYLSDFKQPYFSVAIIFVIIAFYFFLNGKEHKYDVYHGLWHLCSAVIMLMCVLAY